MAFEISFTADPNEFLDDDPTIPSAVGLIRLGTFEENFVSSLYEWKKEDYEAHWLASLRRSLAGADRAVLLCAHDPALTCYGNGVDAGCGWACWCLSSFSVSDVPGNGGWPVSRW